jgi:hypothetical protein
MSLVVRCLHKDRSLRGQRSYTALSALTGNQTEPSFRDGRRAITSKETRVLYERRRRAVALARYRVDLDVRIRRGDSFGDIEDWIDTRPLSDTAKAALWLWLWACQPEENQRQVALDGLRSVGM